VPVELAKSQRLAAVRVVAFTAVATDAINVSN